MMSRLAARHRRALFAHVLALSALIGLSPGAQAQTQTQTMSITAGTSPVTEGTGKSIEFTYGGDVECYVSARNSAACLDSVRVVSIPTVGDTTAESASVFTVVSPHSSTTRRPRP